jgi:anti-sigma factor RsiW
VNCEQLLAMLNEYVDGSATPGICQELEAHLKACNPCQVVVDNIRKTITLYRDGQPYELPVAFQQRLHTMLRERWRQTHPEPKQEA